MKGSLEFLEILMCLDIKNPTLSSTIRERLGNQNINTLNSRLDRLSNQDYIEKINRKEEGDKIKPGGDKIKYKLTKKGINKKKELIKQAKNVLLVDEVEKKELLKTIMKQDPNLIPDVVNEFSKEIGIFIEGKDLIAMQKKLRDLLNKKLLK